MSRLQGVNALFGQQATQLQALIVTLNGLCNVLRPHDKGAIVVIVVIDQFDTVLRGSFSINVSDAWAYLQDLGGFDIKSLAKLDANIVGALERSIASLFAGLVDGISKVFAQ